MTERIIYGTAYYYEYLPMDRMEKDFQMMTRAGFNTIRIAESTWSTWEPKDGVFDFTYLHRVLQCARRFGLSVIIGTPTYAIPAWLAKKYPDILSDTHSGRCRYGARQNFDMTHPGYRFHAERIIRRLLEEVKDYDCVIGFQLDNETKPYDTCSEYAQKLFKDQLIEQYGTTDALNDQMGLAYWSNSIADWDDLPDVRGTINASFGGEYEAFQRSIVTEFLSWQRNILEEYKRPDQFVTHNFDFEWRMYSYGFQPEVDQFDAAKALTITGCDIYHPSEHALTGAEIAFCGAIAYGLKKSNYLVMETEAQGNFGWLPYPGQLRLQAFAHLSCGAEGVSYWHWHSIHNAIESYWKGVLSHDFSEGAVYQEAATIGRDFQRLSGKLIHLRKENRIAIMVSSRSQTGLRWFPTAQQGAKPEHDYSDYLRWICDACYRMNLEYDILNDTERDFSKYDLLLIPVLYAADETLTDAIRQYVYNGGKVIATFKSFFADPVLKIYPDTQPHGLTECFGVHYDRFTKPVNTELRSTLIPLPEHCAVTDWMELLEEPSAEVLCTYSHPAWDNIPAVTRNTYGKGQAVYMGCCFDSDGLEAILGYLLKEWNIALPSIHYPVIIKKGINQEGRQLTYILNFSQEKQVITAPSTGTELLADEPVTHGQELLLPPWSVKILESLN